MVNKIPSYTISAGGKVAILSSRTNPASAHIMAASCRDTLESCGVDTDDIYMIDCPEDLLLPGISRQLAKLGYYSAIVALAALDAESAALHAIYLGMTGTDFLVPVVPALVPANTDDGALARAGEMAARSAVELINLSNMLDELKTTGIDHLAETEEPVAVAKPAPKQRSRKRTRSAASSINGKRTKGRTTR